MRFEEAQTGKGIMSTAPKPIAPVAAVLNPIELWKAIHGGCWPGPPVDTKLTQAVEEVIAGLAVYNLSHSFADNNVATGFRKMAAASLSKSLGTLQKTIAQE